MSDLHSILTKHGYEVNKGEAYINITQDAAGSLLSLFFYAGGGFLGWYMGSQDPELKEIENDPFINDSWFFSFFDFLGTLFILGLMLIGVYMLYNVFKKGTYQLNISKDKIQLHVISGSFTWQWHEIKSFSIDSITESLYAHHISGKKKKLFEFYSKDKSAVDDLKQIKEILKGYCRLKEQAENSDS